MKKAKRFLLWIAFFSLFFVAEKTSASIVFEQIPMSEVNNGAILNYYKFISFGCGLGLDCKVGGKRIYNIGVWMKKIGNPKDVRIGISKWYNTIAGEGDEFSDPVKADSVPSDRYILKWFYFPNGVVIANQYDYNQFFQFQFDGANGTYDPENHYRVVQFESDEYNAPQQWCRTDWGCASSSFYFKLDDNVMDLSKITGPEDPSEQKVEPSNGNIFSQTDSSVVYSTTTTYASFRQNLGKGNSGTINKIKLKIGQDSDYEWNGTYIVELVDMGHNNIFHSGFCYGSPYWINFTRKGLLERDIKFDETSTKCYDSSLNLDPEHYYAIQVTLTYLPYWTNTKLLIAGSSEIKQGTSLSVYNSSSQFNDLKTLFLQIDGIKQGCTENCFSNVLFLPGLEASRLYMDENGAENQLWEPNRLLDVEKLYLDSNGVSKNSGIYTRDIIKETNTPVSTGSLGQNIYKSFSDMMDGLVNGGKINRWESYAYDWRENVEDIVNNGTAHFDGKLPLANVLQTLVETSKNGKVTIVAHSNGGLLAKALLKKLQEDKLAGKNNLIDSVDVLILVAVPQIGTAGAVPAVIHGYDQRILFGWLLNEEHARELGRNMPGAYGLLPSREYINRVNASPATFLDNNVASNITTRMVNTYGSAIDSYEEYKNFLFGNEGRIEPDKSKTKLPISLSSSLFSEAENLHNSIDAWIPPAGLRVIEIAGWGLDTIASFEYYPKYSCRDVQLQVNTCGYIMDQKPRFTLDGDKTVVSPSAQYMSSVGVNGVERYWVDIRGTKIDHQSILEPNFTLDFVKNIIQDNKSIPEKIAIIKPTNNKNKLQLSIHSPATLGVYDTNGNFTGKVCLEDSEFCYVKEEIPNSTYMEFGEGKYLNVDEENFQKATIQGTDFGTFTFESNNVSPNGAEIQTKFINIPVTPQTTGEVVNSSSGNIELKLDINGDNISDITIQSNDKFDPIAYLQVLRKTIENLDITKSRKNNFLNRIDNTIKSINKRKVEKAKLKMERFEDIINKSINKIPKKQKHHQLTKDDGEMLLNMIDNLLNNLN